MRTFMTSEAKTIDIAVQEFSKMRNYRPFAYSGKWFVCFNGEGVWRTYRAKKSAFKNSILGEIYEVTL